jgi:Spy/CpxP family protein refolding chaperone
MKTPSILLAAALALPLIAAHADDMGPGRPPMMQGDEHDGPERGGPGHGPGRAPFFRGIELSEAQEDKVFAILHAEAPYLREQSRAAARAHEALRDMGRSDKYDDAKAAALAQAEASAEANITLQHVRTRQKLLAVLTPEQRKQEAEGKPGRPPRP